MSEREQGGEAAPAWLDQDEPLEPHEHLQQVAALREMLPRGACRVLDLGCGAGRTLVPLVADGHRVIGVDRDPAALERCRRALGDAAASTVLIRGDMLQCSQPIWRDPSGGIAAHAPYDAVCCLGNTFIMVTDPAQGAALFRGVAQVLDEGGCFVIDDFPRTMWRELTEGNWLEGISEDGTMQMIWRPGESIFALRMGDDVRPDDWSIRADEPTYRLWDYGILDLLAEQAGLRPLPRDESGTSMVIAWQRHARPTDRA